MRVLVVGSGAREHALAWRLKQSPDLTGLWVAPGNGGTARIATNLNVPAEDIDGVEETARNLGIDLVVVGPEVPLANGLVDRLESFGIPAFGPSQQASRIESSKEFALQVMQSAGVPCPEFKAFHNETEALAFIERHRQPVVIKADGLAAGKGVSICETPEQATVAVQACMRQRIFGQAGDTVVIEEFLNGPEISVFAFSDGQSLSPLVAACDYKRLHDGDKGPNTGGVGSFTPPDLWSESLANEVDHTIMTPVIEELAKRGTPYRGVLYAGLMLTSEGPKVLEFNCRLGDPEAQVVLPLLDSDPLEAMFACLNGNLSATQVAWSDRSYVGVVMTSGGYPDRYDTGFEITGLGVDDQNTMVFHAATRRVADGQHSKWVTTGGRVLTVVGKGESLAEARQASYDRVAKISFEGAYYRRDIAEVEGRAYSWLPDSVAPTG